jgi:hypothetical protein
MEVVVFVQEPVGRTEELASFEIVAGRAETAVTYRGDPTAKLLTFPLPLIHNSLPFTTGQSNDSYP